ncbi:hypothetical protein HPB49_007299 [Dermacentor silvarum]|uniref:Uncharacterized protein n=1 Tax=Dermacentor silvarum TaxID=543639 RepID=A0ACB8D3Q0_DERSI|nr:hypothetical protein HPB49_007299 [Dermacentor silvarum]
MQAWRLQTYGHGPQAPTSGGQPNALYAAVLKSPFPWYKDIGGDRPRQPQGPVLAWEWLEAWRQWPIDCPDMSAILLCSFLDVAGGALSKNCPWRFHAMAHTLHRCYLPLLKENARTARGAVGRLEVILEEVMQTGYLALPEVPTAR